MADGLAIMHRGRVVEAGPTAEVLREMRHPYTRALFAASGHQPAAARRGPAGRRSSRSRGWCATIPARDAGSSASGEPFHAVRGVSFELDAGESLGLVGESGCGKSTLGRAVLGLEPMQGGSVRVEGEEVRAGERMPRSLRAKMQAVFQDPYGSFNPRHRVARLVAEPFHLLDRPPRGAERAPGGGRGARGRGPRPPPTRRSTSTSSPAASASASPSPARSSSARSSSSSTRRSRRSTCRSGRRSSTSSPT